MAFQVRLLGAQEPTQMRGHGQPIDNHTERPSWNTPVEVVAHDGTAVNGLELMLVPKGAEGSASHLIHEPPRSIELNNLCRQTLPDAEVSSLEGDQVAAFEEPGRAARCDETLIGKGGGCAVHVDIPRQIEAILQGDADQCLESYRTHWVCRGPTQALVYQSRWPRTMPLCIADHTVRCSQRLRGGPLRDGIRAVRERAIMIPL